MKGLFFDISASLFFAVLALTLIIYQKKPTAILMALFSIGWLFTAVIEYRRFLMNKRHKPLSK
ncbi:MAG: hypothetical protein PHI53_01000 [Candidatus Pacebacteria bacterium]|nr:hypothetical protein [Candidatus Paceibacterota bacterium]